MAKQNPKQTNASTQTDTTKEPRIRRSPRDFAKAEVGRVAADVVALGVRLQALNGTTAAQRAAALKVVSGALQEALELVAVEPIAATPGADRVADLDL
jgi:hypothetical protein